MTRGTVEVALWRLGLGLARWLPYRACATCGAAGGWLAGWTSSRRAVVRANLAAVGASRKSASPVPSASSVFASYGRYWGEFLALTARPSRLDRLAVRVEGEEHLQAAAARGPVCVLTGHLGNWDLGARVLVRRLPRLAVVAEEVEPPALFAAFVRAREESGCAVIPAGGGGVRLFRHLRSGGHAAFVADRVFGSGARAVPFLGGMREFPASGMDLARRAGASLVPMFLLRDGRGYRLRIHPSLPPHEDVVASFARALAAEAQDFAAQWCLLYPLHACVTGARPARNVPLEGKAATA